MRYGWLLAFIPWIAMGPPIEQKLDAGTTGILAEVRSYAAEWQDRLLAIVADEHFKQSRRVWRRGDWAGRSWVPAETREMQSEVLLLRAPSDGTWMCFRDIIAVDGKPVRDREQRFDALFLGPSSELATDAQQIADESARFNLGLMRNTNVPTATLVFLEATYAASTRWSVEQNGPDAVVLAFEQRKAPFAVTDQHGRGISADGRVWVERKTGRITRTDLHLRGRGTTSRLRTTYGPARAVDVFVPLQMDEDSRVGNRDRVLGSASYSNHRVWQVHGRVIG